MKTIVIFSHVHFSFVSSELIIMCLGLATSHITMFNKGTKGPANKYFLMFPGNKTREKPHLLALSKLFSTFSKTGHFWQFISGHGFQVVADDK